MTNDKFLKYIDNYVSHPEIEEHAKKLVAVAEAAKLVIPYCDSFNHANKKYQHDNGKYESCPIEKIFQKALEDLERE